jgi:HEAT repeat protein
MTKRRKGYMTLEEHDAQLKAEGKWDAFVERQRQQDEILQAAEAEYARAEAPVVQALRSAGAEISSVWDLVNSRQPYPTLVPILLAHLDVLYPAKVREGIARALVVREARAGWDKLVKSYLSSTDTEPNGVKWALHMAIATAADASVVDTLIHLALNPKHGLNRLLFIQALARIEDPRALEALEELSSDPDLAREVTRIAKKRRKH